MTADGGSVEEDDVGVAALELSAGFPDGFFGGMVNPTGTVIGSSMVAGDDQPLCVISQ